jgi:hypothetical protein
VILHDETEINRFQFEGHAWCSMRDGESSLQAHHVNQIIKDGGGVVLVWGCMTSRGMGYMCNIQGKMTQGLYLSILQDEVMKTIEWHCFNPS